MKPANKYTYDLYYRAFSNTVIEYDKNKDQDINPFIVKSIFYGVKSVITKPKQETITYQEAVRDFQFAQVVMDLMAGLTPKEFMNIFPIEKDFKGHKWDMKDYFYTRDYISTLDTDMPIGDNADMAEFLWAYSNWDISRFNMNLMRYMSNIRQLEGKPSLNEEFANTMGLKTYTKHTDHKGREFLFDKETGKTIRVNKSRPKYLRIIK